MATIETAIGPLEEGELGATLIHEHLLARDEAVALQWPHLLIDEDWSMTFVFKKVFPALRAGGMTDAQLTTMLEENPRRWLAG